MSDPLLAKPSLWQAARAAIGLSILFSIVYGATNWLASLRPVVATMHFEWESRIPFVPAFIVPYMLINAFFVAAPFLCRTNLELRTHSRRIITAILIAGAFFLLMPLRFGFERPHADGFLGHIFDQFRTLDRPFNEFPSLHIAFGTILASFYNQRFQHPWAALLAIWFSLVRLSAVLTYQHHVIDVAGGFLLAALCLHLFQNEPLRRAVIPNQRIGTYYLIGSLACLAGVPFARPWTMLLLWPALSLALSSAAYFSLGPGIFRKKDGRLPFTTKLLLWPILLGQRLSLLYYTRECNPWDRLTERVWIGRVLTDAEARRAHDAGVTAVLDLTSEFPEAPPFLNGTVEYLNIPILDLTAPTPQHIDEAVTFIRTHTEQGTVYIHCKIGYSRSAAIAGAYLLSTGAAKTAEESAAMLRAARPTIVIRPEAMRAIEDYAARLASSRASSAAAA
jgi:protein-tyrosine phosphatase/membrane-associated phospholipid phosphatase